MTKRRAQSSSITVESLIKGYPTQRTPLINEVKFIFPGKTQLKLLQFTLKIVVRQLDPNQRTHFSLPELRFCLASVQSISFYSAVKFRIGKLQKFVYEFGYIPWNMSDQVFYLQIIDRTSFYDCLFSYPNINLLILKTLTFVFKITYYFEVSNFHNFLYLYLKIFTQVSRFLFLV